MSRMGLCMALLAAFAGVLLLFAASAGASEKPKTPLKKWYVFASSLYGIAKGRDRLASVMEPTVAKLLRRRNVHCHHVLRDDAEKRTSELNEGAKMFLGTLLWRGMNLYGPAVLSSSTTHWNETREARLVRLLHTDYFRLGTGAKRSLRRAFPTIATTSERFVAYHLAVYALKVHVCTARHRALEYAMDGSESVSQLIGPVGRGEAELFAAMMRYLHGELNPATSVSVQRPAELSPALEAFLKSAVVRMDHVFTGKHDYLEDDLAEYAKDVKGLYDELGESNEAKKALWSTFPHTLGRLHKWGAHDAVILFLNSLEQMEKDVENNRAKLICG